MIDTPSLFEPSDREMLDRRAPRARASDPSSSHEAAAIIKPANAEMVQAIRKAVWTLGASTAFEIAQEVDRTNPGRWQPDSLRTACSRAGLVKFEGGRTPGGRSCMLYAIAHDDVETRGRT
jgi:hypothetical protein